MYIYIYRHYIYTHTHTHTIYTKHVQHFWLQALEAQKQGWFKEEIVPVTVESKGKARRLKHGEFHTDFLPSGYLT